MADRRFPPPWTFEEANGACFVVKAAQVLENIQNNMIEYHNLEMTYGF